MNPAAQPQPTPFDITNFPAFPYIPGNIAWSFVVLLAVAVLGVILWLRFSEGIPAQLTGARALKEYRKELKALITRADRSAAARAALLTRRLLTALSTRRNYSALTSDELGAVLADTPDHRFEKLIRALLQIEAQRFAPPAEQDYEQTLVALEKAAAIIHGSKAA